MIIRKYVENDRTQLIGLLNRVLPDNTTHNKPNLVIEKKLVIDDLIFVAVLDGKIVGSSIAGYDGHRGWLYSVAVDSSFRRNKIGTNLVTTAVDHLKDRGCLKVNLQIRTRHKEAVSFYQSLGFSIEDRISMGMRVE